MYLQLSSNRLISDAPSVSLKQQRTLVKCFTHRFVATVVSQRPRWGTWFYQSCAFRVHVQWSYALFCLRLKGRSDLTRKGRCKDRRIYNSLSKSPPFVPVSDQRSTVHVETLRWTTRTPLLAMNGKKVVVYSISNPAALASSYYRGLCILPPMSLRVRAAVT